MSHAVAPTLGDRIRGAMAAARIRQVDAAAVLGISQPNLSRRLSGETSWRAGELDTLAALCGVDPQEWSAMGDPDTVNGTDPTDVPKPPSRPLPPPRLRNRPR